MSTTSEKQAQKPISIPDIAARKGGTPVVCLTAYTAPMAKALDPHCDLILVGDSLGMVLYGYDTTLQVTLETMIRHGEAVARSASRAVVVVDMPFGSYEAGPAQAYENAVRILRETGAAAVKLEGGEAMAESIAFLVARGIPVMGHVGLQPQSVHALGGYKARGRDQDDQDRILADAKAVSQAGAFAIVVEGVQDDLAEKLTNAIPTVTIGIGASRLCDGQILVTEDLLGVAAWTPKFVKRYAELGQEIDRAVATYAQEVQDRTFPGPDHVYPALKAR
ncbi:MAG: 3-methyl-2-oxobutanoate hydroxymethyltransferase [Pseudomonadota bacterium]